MLFEKQQHQEDCVANIVRVLQDTKNLTDFASLAGALRALHTEQSIPVTDVKPANRLDVLMETGTGKTFAYLKTILELHKRYAQNKFIIVLPRTAIKLGVIQNIKLTAAYFATEYKKHIEYIDYSGDKLSTVLHKFVNSDELSVLILTHQSFVRKENKINEPYEYLPRGETVWKNVVGKKPVVIIDEPHLLKGEKTTKYLSDLADSLTIRFGATYPSEDAHKLSNVVYALDSICAFNQYLVKQIQVSTVFATSEISDLAITRIKPKFYFDATYNINEQLHPVRIHLKEDIGVKTRLEQYNNVAVAKITADKIFLNNGNVLDAKLPSYSLNDFEITKMVARTIETHFEKEAKLFQQGIKTLSLFFIPGVKDFRGEDPRIKQIFEREYKRIRTIFYKTAAPDYKKYLDADYQDGALKVHEGYFSGDRGKSKTDKDDDGINIILNEKEKLLSLKTPLRFIFSVWALQEGWDNPNIFNICKLATTDKETKRRQQVGRGLRIAVNQNGRRLTFAHSNENENTFYDINALDIIVSGQEKNYIQGIQQEINAGSFAMPGDIITLELLKSRELSDPECIELINVFMAHGIIVPNPATGEYEIKSSIWDFLIANQNAFSFSDARFKEIQALFSKNTRAMVVDKNQRRKQVQVRKNHWNKFKELWEAVNKNAKIVYRDIKEDALLQKIADEFNAANIPALKSRVVTEGLDAQKNQINRLGETLHEYRLSYFAKHSIPEFIRSMSTEHKLPLAFLRKIFARIDIAKLRGNPRRAQMILVDLIKNSVHTSIISSASYEFSETAIYANELQDANGKLIAKIPYTKLGKYITDEEPRDAFLYDTVVYDSVIEQKSIQDDPVQINGHTITVFAKLPKINIPTPYKTYNPDFAYLLETDNAKRLFLVVETKGYKFEYGIPAEEAQKINYAKKFFAALQSALPDVKIVYKTRINKQTIGELLQDVI